MDPRSLGIVGFAVVPDQLDIIQHLLDVLIFIVFEFFADSWQIHGMGDDIEIVGESHAFPVDGLSKIIGLVGLVEAVDDNFDFFGLFSIDFIGVGEKEGRFHI